MTSAEARQHSNAAEPDPQIALLVRSAGALHAEIDQVLSSNSWAINNTGSEHVRWLLYDAASLRHCCRLLKSMCLSAAAGDDLAVRVLARTHLEAWIIGLYLHFGGYPALVRVKQNTRDQVETIQRDSLQFDEWLAQQKKSLRRRVKTVMETNKGIAHWNASNSTKPAKPEHAVPHEPQIRATGLDLSDRIDGLDGHEAQSLKVIDVIEALTKLAQQKGFGQESFRPLYLIYRVLSTTAVHPTLNVYDWYFTKGGFWHTLPEPASPSMMASALVTGVHSTAFLATYVLGQQGSLTPVADELTKLLEPNPDGGSAWASGTLQ